MRTWKLITVNVVVLCGMFFVGHAMSQDKPATAEPGAGMSDMQSMMKKWMATVKPGASHKWLEQFVGKWNTTTKMWMDPNAPAMETKGTAETKSILGGRFILEETAGEMLMPGPDGQMKKIPHSGLGMIGYDNYRHMYVGTFADTGSTALLNCSGQLDQAGKTLTMYGEMDEPMLDVVARHVKYVTKIESDKKFVFTIYDLHAGDHYKVVEITYEKQ